MPNILWQTRPVLLEGLDAKSDPKSVLDGKLLTLENGVWARPGAINKRADLHTQFGASGGSVGVGIHKRGDTLLHLDGSYIRASKTAAAWTSVGNFVPVSVKQKTGKFPELDVASGSRCHIDSCYYNGVMVVAGFTPDGVSANGTKLFVSVVDWVSGLVVYSYTATSATMKFAGVRCARAGTKILIFYGDNTDIKVVIVDTASPTSAPGTATIAANLTAAAVEAYMDACTDATGNYVYLAYVEDWISVHINVAKVDSTGAVTTGPVNIGAANGAYAPTITRTTADDLFIFWLVGTTLKGVAYTNALVAKFAPAQTVVGVAYVPKWAIELPSTANTVVVATDTRTTLSDNFAEIRTYTLTSAGVASTYYTGPNANLCGKPFVRGTDIIYPTAYIRSKINGTDTDSTVWAPIGLLVDLFTGKAVARYLDDALDEYAFNQVNPYVTGNTVTLFVPATFAAGGVSGSGVDGDVPQIAEMTFDFSARITSIEQADSTFFSGGLPFEWDGKNFVEMSMNMGPDNVTAADSLAAGSIPAGTYQVTQLFAWRGASGRLYKSAPANPKEVVLGGTGQIQITSSLIPVSLRAYSEVYLVTYMTTGTSGSVFYEVDRRIPSSGLFPGFNLTTVPAGTELLLYTTGGILPHYPPPACWNLCTRGNRIFAACNDGHVHYTKELADGEAAAQFCDEFVKIRPGADSEPFYVAEMDGNVFAFHKKGIAVFGGPGPGDTGLGEFTDFQEIAVDVPGISDYAKAVPIRTDAGLFFWTNRGPMLLNRQLQIEPVGLAIETACSGLTCLDIVPLPTRYQVWFLTASKIFVFDYLLKRWSTFPLSYTAVGMVEIDNVVYIAGSDGKVYKELASTFKSTDILKFRTGWIRPENYMGEFRVRKMLLLGTKKSAATITVKVYFDYSDTAEETHTLAISTPWASEPAELVVPLSRQRCQAVSFEVYDGSLSGTNEGVTISSVHLEIGLMPDRIVKVGSSRITS